MEKTLKFNEKSMQKWMLFDGSEPRLALYSLLISHFRHFQKRLKNQCKKGLHNSCFFMKDWYFWTPGSFDSVILVVFGRYRKIVFFLCRTMEVQKREKSILARPRDPRGTPGIHQGWHFNAQPPPGKHHLSKNRYKPV